jgi:uncharacterized OB-fold protein
MVHPDAEFREFLAEGRFMLQRQKGGAAFYPPRTIAPVTGSEDIEWFEPTGRGTVYSTTVVRRKPPEPSYNVCLVELAEGPRMMTRVEGIDPAEVRIGMPVVARVIDQDGQGLVVFVPENAA